MEYVTAGAAERTAILITARHWTAQYEWYAHYPLAIKAGLILGLLTSQPEAPLE